MRQAIERIRVIGISGVVGSLILLAGCHDQWKATGDGRTIFNPRTGEIVNTGTGKTVRESAAKRAEAQRKRAEA